MSDVTKFRGRTPGLALRQAREELGDDARLVSARRVSAPGLPPLYEVQVMTTPAAKDDVIPALRRELAGLREEIGSLRAGVLAQVPAAAAPAAPVEPATTPPDETEDPALAPWFQALERGGASTSTLTRVRHDAARALPDGADIAAAGTAVRDALRGLLGDGGGDDLGLESLVVVGPSGSGKTTTLAKIAAERVGRGEEPVLVSADGESLHGEDELAAIAEALALPFETAFVDGRLEEIVERHGAGRVYLVDTPGRSPFAGRGLDPVPALVAALPAAERVLVLDAGRDLAELRAQIDAWAPVSPGRVVLSKLDELARPGRLLDAAIALSLPIARVSFGRSARGTSAVPGDARVLARILGTELAVERTA
ncbi:MAG: hypothetical protein R3B81_11245 [bacterium]